MSCSAQGVIRNSAQALGNSADEPNSVTLNTKVFVFDRRYLFVGSLNLYARSVEIDAKMGLLINSEEFSGGVDAAAYRVIENDRGQPEWHATIDDRSVIESKEPLTNWWLRFKALLFKIVPESQL